MGAAANPRPARAARAHRAAEAGLRRAAGGVAARAAARLGRRSACRRCARPQRLARSGTDRPLLARASRGRARLERRPLGGADVPELALSGRCGAGAACGHGARVRGVQPAIYYVADFFARRPARTAGLMCLALSDNTSMALAKRYAQESTRTTGERMINLAIALGRGINALQNCKLSQAKHNRQRMATAA